MKFHDRSFLLSILFFLSAPCLTVSGQQPNGGIITLKGDTISCTIVLNPKDADIRSQAGKAYLYDYTVALFNNDSLRILYPGNIRAFFVKRDNQKNIPPLWYLSDSIDHTHDMLFKKPQLIRPVFLQQLVTGGYYHLWFFEQADPGSRNDRVFVLEESSTGLRRYFNSTRQLRKLLGKWPGSGNRVAGHKDWLKEKQLMVIDYNKYKAGE